jgi:hypothetical protein
VQSAVAQQPTNSCHPCWFVVRSRCCRSSAAAARNEVLCCSLAARLLHAPCLHALGEAWVLRAGPEALVPHLKHRRVVLDVRVRPVQLHRLVHLHKHTLMTCLKAGK